MDHAHLGISCNLKGASNSERNFINLSTNSLMQETLKTQSSPSAVTASQHGHRLAGVGICSVLRLRGVWTGWGVQSRRTVAVACDCWHRAAFSLHFSEEKMLQLIHADPQYEVMLRQAY